MMRVNTAQDSGKRQWLPVAEMPGLVSFLPSNNATISSMLGFCSGSVQSVDLLSYKPPPKFFLPLQCCI